MALQGSITTVDSVVSADAYIIVKEINIKADLSATAVAYIYMTADVSASDKEPMEKIIFAFTFVKAVDEAINAFAQAQTALKASTSQALLNGTATSYDLGDFEESAA